MTDELGYGAEKRRQGNLDILAGKVTFRCVRIGRSYLVCEAAMGASILCGGGVGGIDVDLPFDCGRKLNAGWARGIALSKRSLESGDPHWRRHCGGFLNKSLAFLLRDLCFISRI